MQNQEKEMSKGGGKIEIEPAKLDANSEHSKLSE